MSPLNKLYAFQRQFPETKTIYPIMQKWQIEHGSQFDYFYPYKRLATDSTYITSYAQRHALGMTSKDDDMYVLRYANGLLMFGAWRNTLGIYRIDPDIYNELLKSPIPNDTPVSTFRRLPEWCVYIEVPTFIVDGKYKCKGFWAYYLEHYKDSRIINGETLNQVQLHIVLDYICSDKDALTEQFLPISLLINDSLTVNEAIESLYYEYENKSLAEKDGDLIKRLLPILLWLCAEEPDITNALDEPLTFNQIRQPKYTIHKKSGLFVPPNKPFIYDLGKRLGGEIRLYQQRINDFNSNNPKSSIAPHTRKGHWHGYWYGSGDNKRLEPKWVKATFVNAK